MFKRGKQLLVFSVAIMFMLVSMPFLFGFVATTPIGNVFANSSDDFYHRAPTQSAQPFSSAPMTLANSNFSEAQTEHFIESIGSWDFVTDSEGTQMNSGGAMVGTLNTFGFYTFRENNSLNNVSFLQHNPGVDRGNVLAMVNRTENAQSVIGKQSNELYFPANGFFIVEIDFYAVRSVNSIYLLPSEELPNGIQNNITINQVIFQDGPGDNPPVAENQSLWRTASFLVQTCPMQGRNFRVGLFLGGMGRPSAGVVYYNAVRVSELSQAQFNTDRTRILGNAQQRSFVREMDFRTHTESQHFGFVRTGHDNHQNLNNDSFRAGFPNRNNPQQEMHSFTFPAITASSVWSQLGFHNAEVNPVSHFHPHALPVNRQIMLLQARNSYAGFIMNRDTTVRIDRNVTYMLTFYTITSGGVGTVRIQDTRIHDTNLDQAIVPFFEEVPFMTELPSGVHTRNNWVRNTIFLRGEAFDDRNIEIEFLLGSENAPTTGWIAIDEISMTRVSHQFYSANNEALNTVSFNMNNQEPTPTIANSFFNVGTPRSADNPFPLVANNWNHVFDEVNPNATRTGIVNTQTQHWNRYAQNVTVGPYAAGRPDAHRIGSNYGMAINPGSIRGQNVNNNVLMMQNIQETYQSIESNTFQLGAGIHNVISFDVSAQRIAGHEMNFYAMIMMNNRELRRIDLSHLTQRNGWQNFSFAIMPPTLPNDSLELSLSFIMGTPNRPSPAGVAFIDNVIVEEVPNFNINQPRVTFINLSNIISHSNPNGSAMFFSAGDMSATVLGTNAGAYAGHLLVDSVGRRAGGVVSTQGDHIQGGIFYVFTVELAINEMNSWVRRQHDLVTGELLTEPTDVDHGISFGFRNFEGGFENLRRDNTRDLIHNGNFIELQFFVRTDVSQDLIFEITFGNEWRYVESSVVIRSINVEEITQTEWNIAYNEVRDANRDGEATNMAMVNEIGYIHTPDDPDGGGGGSGFGELSMFVIPSIILGVALIFAIAMVAIRKVKKRRRMAQGTTSYANDNAGIGGSEALVAKPVKGKAAAQVSTEEEII